MVNHQRGCEHFRVSTDPERRFIDSARAGDATAAVADPESIQQWAQRFSVVADPSRLTLLVCIHHAGEICVSDLATATGMSDTAVSQALRLLRAHGLVSAHRSGRVVRYKLTDRTVHDLIHHVRPHPGEGPHHVH